MQKNKLKILQCGHDKSGTYLLYRVLSDILKQNSYYRSFISSSGIGLIIDRLLPENKRYPEVSEVDYIRTVNGVWGINFPSPNCRHVPVDLDLLLNYSTLCYTHETPTITSAIHDRFSHRVYLMRDGRDVVNSMIYFLTNDISLRLSPEYSIREPQKLYNDLAYFEGLVRRWHAHIMSFNEQKDNFFLVRFEDLLSRRQEVIERLGGYMGLTVNISDLVNSTTFETMKKNAPQHLRKGGRGEWKSFFTDRHKNIFKDIAGNLLVEQGYEDSHDW